MLIMYERDWYCNNIINLSLTAVYFVEAVGQGINYKYEITIELLIEFRNNI